MEKRLDWFRKSCREAGLKVTPQRLEIYRQLAATAAHPDADTLWRAVRQRLPRVSCDTVYRNLRSLEERGIIRKIGATGYRARFDADIEPHHHFMCRRCSAIIDVPGQAVPDPVRPPSLEGVGEVRDVHVEYSGVCRRCLSMNKKRGLKKGE